MTKYIPIGTEDGFVSKGWGSVDDKSWIDGTETAIGGGSDA